MTEKVRELSALSASKVKTLENCSWLYWATYHLKLPNVQNDGARKGEVCHSVFEVLINTKYKKLVAKLIKAESLTSFPSLVRLTKKYMKKVGLADTVENFKHIDEMIIVGLKSDFYVKGGKLIEAELKFDIIGEGNKYRIKGFMDKPFIVGGELVIDDYKSSKKKFEGEDKESNLQAMFYSFAGRILYPHLDPKVRFIFLQYPEDPMMEVKFSADALSGFEHFLEATQRKVETFDSRTAHSHFAYDETPPKGEFKGRLLCGFASKPGELKKDGTKKWHCPYKFGFDYYSIKKDGRILYSVFDADKDKVKLKPGEVIEKIHYKGCPKHCNALDDFSDTPIIKKEEPKKYSNVLDDF